MMTSYYLTRMAEIDAAREAHRRANPLPEIAPAPPKPVPQLGYVYFFRAGNTVKIGFSTNLRERTKTLQTACSERAFMVKFIEGTLKTERRMHERFADYRVKGEWFELRGTLAKYLEQCIYPIEFPAPVEKIEEEIIDFRF